MQKSLVHKQLFNNNCGLALLLTLLLPIIIIDAICCDISFLAPHLPPLKPASSLDFFHLVKSKIQPIGKQPSIFIFSYFSRSVFRTLSLQLFSPHRLAIFLKDQASLSPLVERDFSDDTLNSVSKGFWLIIFLTLILDRTYILYRIGT